MALNLAQMTLTPPQIQHGAAVSARLPMINAGDAQGLANAAAALGMQAVGTNQYQHPVDGSWAILNGPRVERGIGNIHFRGMPVNLTTLTLLPQGQNCAARSIAPNNANPAAVVAQLANAGFAETSKGFFAHADGSWVAVTPDVGIMRGLGNGRLHAGDLPAAPAQPATPSAPAPSQAATGPTAAGVLQYPQKAPAFQDGFLMCAFPGRLDPSQLAASRPGLVQLGFVEVNPGFFEHPMDHSWVAFSGQTIERGIGKARFNKAPVNPTRLTQIQPPANGSFLSVADTALQQLKLADVLKNDSALRAAGFTALGNGVYKHPDGCFIGYTPNQAFAGHNQQTFSQWPQPLNAANAKPSRREHGHLALANTADCTANTPNLAQKLGGLGFSATIANVLYTHADGSWVAVKNGQIFRGVGPELLSDVPKPPPPGSVVQDTSRPPVPQSMLRPVAFAITQVGICTTANVHTNCKAHGFVDLGGVYWHADGSWVSYAGGRIAVGWKGYPLNELRPAYVQGWQ